MDVAAKLSNASPRKKRFGTVVCGMMLQLLDIANGQEASILDGDLDQNLQNAFPHLIDKYKSSFKPVKVNQFQSVTDTPSVNRCATEPTQSSTEKSVYRSITVPSKPIGHQYATCQRIKPMVEIIQDKHHNPCQYVNNVVKVCKLIPNKTNLLKP